MKLGTIKSFIKIIANLKFAIVILGLIAIGSSLGSVIEQDQALDFYKESYPKEKPIYGFINFSIILKLGLDHVYNTWWFLALLLTLGMSLLTCTFTRQFPLVKNSKDYFFKKEKKSYLILPFSIQLKHISFFKEKILIDIYKKNFYIYQTKNLVYGYKGLIGRLSPIFVHISLLFILIGSALGSFENFKAQEILPKGEIFHIQNPIKIGVITKLPKSTIRINDFWVEYENTKIHQFYSNISIIDSFGTELEEQTISVNNPLRYHNVDFYQSDWNLIGIRCLENSNSKKIYELPLLKLKENNKSWITWINNNSIIFNTLNETFYNYNENGELIGEKFLGETLKNNWKIIDIISSTGLLVKYDPSILIIYIGFGLLIITTILSYLPYTQIWIFNTRKSSWIGGTTNRGKIQLELDFENLIRKIENLIIKSILITKKK